MRKEVKFPIAAVFSLLNVLLGLINIFYTFTRIGGMPTSTVVRASVWCIITLLSGILLTIVLFMRKRGALLWVPLGLELAIDLYYLCTFVSGYAFSSLIQDLFYLGIRIIPVVTWLLLLLFAIFQDWKEESGTATLFRKIWFVPGILNIFGFLGDFVGRGGFNLIITIVSGLLASIPMAFLLGWWLTRPYKKEKPIYQMPVAQPYGQPVYQSVGAFDAAQKVICSGCGRELLPDEMFCAGCGTRRPEPPQTEPDAANQTVFCSGCGRELPPDEDFCCVCGTRRPNLLQDETIVL